MAVGILAYGSLIDEPGDELKGLIYQRIPCETPFKVEYARISKSRDFAPTLIPVESEGAIVNACILLLHNTVTLDDAKNMLWRRETRRTRLSYKPQLKPGTNDVQIIEIKNFNGVDTVIYTSIGQNLGPNTPPILAKLAIDSILNAAGEKKIDGVRYLLNAIKNGVITPKTREYEKFILEATETNSLEEAIEKLDQARPKHLITKVEIDDFEKQVVEIADLFCEYGFKETFRENFNPKEYKVLLEKNREAFIKNCHDGFKKGQQKVLKLMLELEERKMKLQDDTKLLRKKKDKNSIQENLDEIKNIEWKEDILRHLIDTTAWQMIGGQVWISRRLYQGVSGAKRLKMSNINSVISAAAEFNTIDSDFALITDLSSYIQTGDILLKKGDGSITLVEVKEGQKNEELLKILDKIINTKNDSPIDEIMKSFNWNKKSLEQFERNLKQFQKAFNVTAILNNDEGKDSSGRSIKIITPQEETPRFERELLELTNELQKSNMWAYKVIESCLHIGMYKGPLKFIGKYILEQLGKRASNNFIIVNFIQVVNSLHKPLLMLPFPKEFLFDIMFRRTNLYFMLDIEQYLALFPSCELEAKWLSRKETMKAVEGHKNSGIFIHKGRGIKVSSKEGDQEMFLTTGLLTKIFFEHIYPSYTAFSCRYLLGIEEGAKKMPDNKVKGRPNQSNS